ncbi:DUF6705 family protein [Chryseobacterium zhengzhouense]|uniref:DUF6705 family protein n=1 Tax=Chryseobacterium zhengzhouense TaxID=1636086 RepID=A0ABW2M5F6_9FLAO
MKNLYIKIIITNVLFFTIMIKSQTVIVRGENNGPLPDNFLSSGQYYYKDVNNYLDKFIGTWEYTNGNEKFQIILTKIIKYNLIDTELNYNFYEDGISVKYKKIVNGNVSFESPTVNEPSFTRSNGTKLEGYMIDYGRVTVNKQLPLDNILNLGVLRQGGEYFHPSCTIEILPLNLSEPPKIKFSLRLRQNLGGEYKNPAYNGLPTFSIPNNIIMTKL